VKKLQVENMKQVEIVKMLLAANADTNARDNDDGFENSNYGRGFAPTGRVWRPVHTKAKKGPCADGSPEPSDGMCHLIFMRHRVRHGRVRGCSFNIEKKQRYCPAEP
jgi:hypothetical protein